MMCSLPKKKKMQPLFFSCDKCSPNLSAISKQETTTLKSLANIALTPLVSVLFCAIKPFTLSARSEPTGSGGRVETQKAFILKYLTAVYGEKLTTFRF